MVLQASQGWRGCRAGNGGDGANLKRSSTRFTHRLQEHPIYNSKDSSEVKTDTIGALQDGKHSD